MKAAIVGGGVIGGGWAARFLLNGWDVAVFDPDRQAPRKLAAVLENARLSLPLLSDLPLPPEGRLLHAATLDEAVAGADYIQESVSERLDLKYRVFAQIQHTAPVTPIGSSTSGYRPSQLQEGAANPAAIFVAHPFNPVYLLPLVEVVPGPAADPALIERVKKMLQGLGMFPLHLRREIDAHIADRFLEAVWREALWLVKDGIATTEEIDEAIRMGFGLRWGQMGLFETYRIAGGEAGMEHFMAQFGPCLTLPWTRLTDVPEFDDALVSLIAGQSDAQSGHLSIRALERIRDANLVGFLRVLKARDWGAGRVLNAHDAARHSAPEGAFAVVVRPEWAEADGTLGDAGWLAAATAAADAQAGGYRSTETHVRQFGTTRAGDALTATVRLLGEEGARHLMVAFTCGNDLVATVERTLVPVNPTGDEARTTPPEPQARLSRTGAADAHPGALPQGDG